MELDAQCVATISDVAAAHAELTLAAAVLEVLSSSEGLGEALNSVLLLIKDFAQIEAIGLRLTGGDGFPYSVAAGFPEDFLAHQSLPCGFEHDGELHRASGDWCERRCGCMCGSVLMGAADLSLPCFTVGGSFWTNSTTDLLASPAGAALAYGTLQYCNAFGYESVALIPLRAGNTCLGLLQLNDSRPDRLTIELVLFLEKLADALGIALAHHLADEKVHEQARILDAILAASPVGIILIRDRIVQWTNETTCRMLGIPAGETIGGSSRRFYRDAAEWERVGRELYSGTTPLGVQAVDAVLVRADGTSFDCHLKARRLVPDDPSQGYIVVLSDITARKQAEEAERLAAVGQLAAGVIHDVNNLLSSIRGWAALVQKGRADCQQDMLDVVMRATAQGAAIMENLMALAAPQEATREATRIEAAVEAVLSVANPQLIAGGIEVVRKYQPEGRPVAVDQAEVGRILLNLVINAIDAMPRGGRLTVSTEYTDATSGPGELTLAVTDTGTGIRPEDLQHIFEPFFTTKAKSEDGHGQGTGLGLYIIQSIVTSHGGSIVVRTEVGKGTVFEVHLPTVVNGNHADHAPRSDR